MGDEGLHICELQVAHEQMLMARKGLPGHAVYNKVRNATELLALSGLRGFGVSVDVAGLGDFLDPANSAEALQQGCQFLNWLEDDKPMHEWHGVTVDEHDNVTAVDLRVLDPSLERHHRLPHL